MDRRYLPVFRTITPRRAETGERDARPYRPRGMGVLYQKSPRYGLANFAQAALPQTDAETGGDKADGQLLAQCAGASGGDTDKVPFGVEERRWRRSTATGKHHAGIGGKESARTQRSVEHHAAVKPPQSALAGSREALAGGFVAEYRRRRARTTRI